MISLLLLILVSGDDDADVYIERLARVSEQAPLSLDFNGQVSVDQMGMAMRMEMAGTLMILDARRERTEIDMTMRMPNQTEGNMPSEMEMDILNVNDGETTWIEVNMPAMGMLQVMKMSSEAMDRFSKSQGVQGMSFSSFNPKTLVESLRETLVLEVVSVADGRVTLAADLTDEAKERFKLPPNQASGIDRMTLVMDETNVFPLDLQMLAGEEPFLTLSFRNLQPNQSFEESLFAYQPPEGVMVQDMDAMLESMGQ